MSAAGAPGHARTTRRGGVVVRTVDSDPRSPRPLVVLLPRWGAPGGADFWALAPMLATRYRTVVVEVSTTDGGTAGEDGATLPAIETALTAVRGHGAAHLVGFSSGAATAVALAVRNPGWTASATLVAGWATTDPHQRLTSRLAGEVADRPGARQAWSALSAFTPEFLAGRTEEEVRTLLERCAWLATVPDLDVADQLGRLRVPTFVVACTADVLAPPRHARLLAGAVPHSRYAEVAAGHGVLTERPSEVFDHLDRFLRDTAARTPGTVPALHA
ncbi:alpha/beta fold hydrolase [Kineococcus sp. SYSU DK001]|uniref:alpha/beta fold hydrolase n=1 Tax=Kineococcus sp. SYSU DK001 TaxID=3383122 RepID=UPI003D7D4074